MIDFVWNSLKKFVYSIYDWCIYLYNGFSQFLSSILSSFSNLIFNVNKAKPKLKVFDQDLTVLDYIKNNTVEQLFELISYFGFNTSKINFNTNEIDLLVAHAKDIQKEFKFENANNFIVTDSITFQIVRNKEKLLFSIEINQDILNHQIKDNIRDFFGVESTLTKKVCKVLTPVLSGGHFYLLQLDLNINKIKDTDWNFVITHATLVDSLSTTNNQVQNHIKQLVNLLNNGDEVDYSLVNTKEQIDNYTCGPRVTKSIIEHLNLYSDDIVDKYPLLQNLKDLPKGANPYKEITFLLGQAYQAKEMKIKDRKLANPDVKLFCYDNLKEKALIIIPEEEVEEIKEVEEIVRNRMR